MSDSLGSHGVLTTRILCPWDFPGKNTGLGCHFFLQGIFPTQGLNQPRDWTCASCIGRWICYHWATWEANKAPRILLQKQRALSKYYLLFNLLFLFSKIHCLCKYIKRKLDDFLDKIMYSHKIWPWQTYDIDMILSNITKVRIIRVNSPLLLLLIFYRN